MLRSIMLPGTSGIVRIVIIILMTMFLFIFEVLVTNRRYEHSLSHMTAMAANSSGVPHTPIHLVSTIKPLAKLLANDNPSLEQALRLLGCERYALRNNEIVIDRQNYKIRIRMLENTTDRISEISFYCSSKSGLQMKDIVSVLGKIGPERYHMAKAYHTRYGYYNPANRVLSYVIISTLTVPTYSASPVTSITIRRDEKPPPEIFKLINPITKQ